MQSTFKIPILTHHLGDETKNTTPYHCRDSAMYATLDGAVQLETYCTTNCVS
jgi:transcription initiation factor IIE alpha subunit